MTNKILLTEVNAILDNLDKAAKNRGHTTTASSEKASNGKIISSWVKSLYNKLKSIASGYAYSTNPMLQIPVAELENGAVVYDKVIEAARQIYQDISNNITCNSCKSNCVNTSVMSSKKPVKDTSSGTAKLH